MEGQTLTCSGAGVAVMLVLKAMLLFLGSVCLPSYACTSLIVVLMVCIYEKSEVYIGDVRASVSPDEGTLIPEGFYSNYSKQSNKNIISPYRCALKVCYDS